MADAKVQEHWDNCRAVLAKLRHVSLAEAEEMMQRSRLPRIYQQYPEYVVLDEPEQFVRIMFVLPRSSETREVKPDEPCCACP